MNESKELIKLNINGQDVQIEEGKTILNAAESMGIKIPTICYMKNTTVSGACRMCVVEVESIKNLVPACAYPVFQGMVVKTHSPRVINARKTILQLMIANHPMTCLTCEKNKQCTLQDLANEYGISDIPYKGKMRKSRPDLASPAIERDPDKCILCGKCVKVCEELQGVNAIDFTKRGFDTTIAPAFAGSLSESTCVNCGQCIMVCPTGALREKSSIKQVQQALTDKSKFVVVQTAPAIRVTIGEAMGLEAGEISTGRMITALRKIGFNKVFDTDFAADLTVMEEGSELIDRIQNNGMLPMMTSCSPGWIKYVENFYPELIPNLSSCKSPHEMLGAVIKSFYAQKIGVEAKNIFVVSVMPCTAKKFEAQREELEVEGIRDVDFVLTTRELVKMIKSSGLDFANLEEGEFDNPLGTASGAGDIFASSGGVTEAAIRTVYYLITGKEMPNLNFIPARGLKGIKEATIDINGLEVKVAIASSLTQAQILMEKIKQGESEYHFIEVMTCPGGCIGGGGQPFDTDVEKIKARLKSLYDIDKSKVLRVAHKNPHIQELYKQFLGKPLSATSHKYLHTHYKKRENI